MPPTLTNRELKNKSTGIDMIVPEYQIIAGKIVNTVLYHVIVITRLFYFKTRQHKESDLVQFAVAKKYEEVEDLHTKLTTKFPSVNFPPLPRMSLIATEKVLSERKKFLETLLNLIAKTPKLCCSTPVLEFLEVNKISIKQNQLKNYEAEKPKEEVKEEKGEILKEPEQDIFGISKMDNSEEESEEDDETDVGVVDMKRPSVVKQKDGDLEIKNTKTENSDNFLKSSGKFSFGAYDDDRNVRDLFIPEEALKSDESKLFVSEDDPDLLQIDDDLDKLLNISKKKNDKKQPAPKPRAPPKPDLKPRPTPKPRFAETTSPGDDNFFSKPVAPPKPKPRKRTKPECDSKTDKAVKNASAKQKANEETLNDIFGKPSGKNLFTGVNDDDDDLFKPKSSESVDVDDISKYIEQNIGQTTHEEVDLFS